LLLAERAGLYVNVVLRNEDALLSYAQAGLRPAVKNVIGDCHFWFELSELSHLLAPIEGTQADVGKVV
jgi:hypothetical protein